MGRHACKAAISPPDISEVVGLSARCAAFVRPSQYAEDIAEGLKMIQYLICYSSQEHQPRIQMPESWSRSMRRLRQRYVNHQTSGNAKVHFHMCPRSEVRRRIWCLFQQGASDCFLSTAVVLCIASAFKHPCVLVLPTPLSSIEVPPDAEL